MTRKQMLAVLGGVVVVGVAAPALAFKFYMTSDNTAPLRWWQRPSIQYHLATVAPEETPAASLQGFVDTAFEAWIGTPCGLVPEVTFAGTSDATHATTPASVNAAPDNVIVFIKTTAEWTQLGNSPTWIAITKIAHDPTTGEIVDADIEINDGGYVFSYDDSPDPSQVDFLSMLTHEVGHFYGLDHSLNTDATMYARYANDAASAMQARTLSQDDIDGICALYTDKDIVVDDGSGAGLPISAVPVHKDPSKDSGGCDAGGGAAGLWGIAGLLVMLCARSRSRSR